MSECTHDCGSCSSDCPSKGGIEKDRPHALSKIKKIIGIISGKGGVGKSSVTALLALAMARKGYKCGILDADITGPSIPRLFGLKETLGSDGESIYPAFTRTGIRVVSSNLLLNDETDPIIYRGPLLASMVREFFTEVVWGDLDYLFIDMPPGTGDVVLTVFQSLPVDGLIVVTSPQELVSMIVGKAVKMAKMMHLPILGVAENFAFVRCPKCGEEIAPFGEGKVDEVATAYELSVLARLPIDPAFASLCDAGKTEEFETPREMSEAIRRLEALLR